jgi:hypothetical protein
VTRQTVNGPDGTAGTDDDHLQNPGYPFWVAGIEDIVGQRPPTPQLDMLPIADAEELIGLVPDDPTTPVGPDADRRRL